MTTRDVLRDDLLSALAANRELPPNHDSEVVETLLDHWSQTLDINTVIHAPCMWPDGRARCHCALCRYAFDEED